MSPESARNRTTGATCAGRFGSGLSRLPPRRDQRGFVRNAARWAVHSEVRPSGDELLPCQPHTHVIVWAWCLYSAMTCLRGSLTGVAAGRGGRMVPLDTMGVTSQGWRSGDAGRSAWAIDLARKGTRQLREQEFYPEPEVRA